MLKTIALAFAAAFIALPVFALPAGAAGLLDAPVSFTATRTVTIDGRTYTGRVYHQPGHERHEQRLGLMDTVFLLDGEAGEGYLVVPSVKTYVDFPFPPLLSALAAAQLEKSPIGEEVVDHVPTAKYRIADTAPDGTHGEGFAWVSRRGVLMKLQGTVTLPSGKKNKIAMQLADVKEVPLDRALFAPPAEMQELPFAALAPLLGTAMR
jgi:hypothetical protein